MFGLKRIHFVEKMKRLAKVETNHNRLARGIKGC
jgi:hypothetical protein